MIELFVYTQPSEDKQYYTTMLKYNEHRKIFQGVYNNIYENEAILRSLKFTLQQITNHNHIIKIHTTSKYINNTISYKWFEKWDLNGWITNDGSRVKYRDLWLDIWEELNKFDNILFVSPKDKNNDNLLYCKDRTEEVIYEETRTISDP